MNAASTYNPEQRPPTKAEIDAAYREHSRYILSYINKRVRSAALAEDLMQETFIEAMGLKFVPEGWRAMLTHIAWCRMLIHWKRLRSRPVESELFDTVPAMGENPLHSVVTDEIYQELYRALDELPRPQRKIINLRYFGELRADETRKILNVSKTTAYNLTSEGLRALRNTLFYSVRLDY